MSAIDHERIYLQPPCCADEDVGRLWCEDPDPTDCEDGKAWTEYVRADIYDQVVAEPVGANTELLEWLETEISAIDLWYRGSPTYERDGMWVRDEAIRLIEKAKCIFAAQPPAVASSICPVCGEGVLSLRISDNEGVPFFYHTCSVCGCEQASPDISRINKHVSQWLNKPPAVAVQGQSIEVSIEGIGLCTLTIVDGKAVMPSVTVRDIVSKACLPKHEQGDTIVNLNNAAWELIQKAASESKWMPPEYSQNEWVSDVCEFLRHGRNEQPVAVPTSEWDMERMREVLTPEEINALPSGIDVTATGTPRDWLERAFVWDRTEPGYNYWSDVADRLDGLTRPQNPEAEQWFAQHR